MADQKKNPLELFWFSLPSAPLLALSLPISIFIPPYYATHLGLPLATISAIFVAARLFDLAIDPVLGGWQDRTVSRFGRRRIWIIAAAIPLMALAWLTFIGMPQGASPLVATGAILALYGVFAAMMIAHIAWAGELRPTYHGRTAALGALQVTGLVGQISMLALAAFVVQSGLGSDADAVHAMGWTVVAAIPICVLLCCWLTPEPNVPPQPHLGLKDALKAITSNAPLRGVLVPDLLTGIASGVQAGLFLFFFQHVLEFWRESQTLLFIYFVSGLIGVPLWVWLGQKFGKHRALQIACVYLGAPLILLLLVPKGAFAIAGTLMFLGGLATAAPGLLLRSMMADVVDEDEIKTEARRTGLYFGLLLTTNKVGYVAGPLTYVFLDLAGFNATAQAENSQAALTTLTVLFIAVPIALNLLAAFLLRSYKLDEARQSELRAQIEAREAAR